MGGSYGGASLDELWSLPQHPQMRAGVHCSAGCSSAIVSGIQKERTQRKDQIEAKAKQPGVPASPPLQRLQWTGIICASHSLPSVEN